MMGRVAGRGAADLAQDEEWWSCSRKAPSRAIICKVRNRRAEGEPARSWHVLGDDNGIFLQTMAHVARQNFRMETGHASLRRPA